MGDNGLTSEGSTQQPSITPLSSKEATGLMIEEAERLVNQLVDSRGHDKPPFLPEEYSRLLDIKEIRKTKLGDTSGLLLKFHDGYVIKINQDHNQARQNFSFAHEIGHIFYNDLKLDDYVHTIEYRTANSAKTVEKRIRAREELCDAAAAELLMPELVFSRCLSDVGLSIATVEHLANVFKVSIQALIRRIAQVSIEPCVALVWYPWPKRNPKGLRPALGGLSKGRPNYVPVHRNVDTGSALYKAFMNDTIMKTWKLFKSGNVTSRLPVEAKGFGRGETRFVVSVSPAIGKWESDG